MLILLLLVLVGILLLVLPIVKTESVRLYIGVGTVLCLVAYALVGFHVLGGRGG